MKKIKRNYVIIFILVLMAFVCFSASYAFLTNVNEQHGKLNIKVGDLKYKIESDKLDSGNITVPANTTQELTIKLTSLNEIDSKYELYYQIDSANDSVNVGYSPDTENPVFGSISANDSKNITIVIANKSSSSTKISFGVVGGLIKNDLVLSIGNSLNKEVIGGKVFANAILADNNLITAAPTLTNSSNNTSDASGLYKSTDTDSGNPTYYFRGNVTNNYVKFADLTWRIIRINEDGTVRMILDGAIDNNNYKYSENSSSFIYSYYSNSSIKGVIENWYSNNLSGYTNYISSQIFCEQAKVCNYSYDDSVNDQYDCKLGSETLQNYDKYTPSFKCTSDLNGYGAINSKVGLLNYDELIYAGGYPHDNSSNYYIYLDDEWTTMSPIEFSNSAGIWSIYYDEIGLDSLVSGEFFVIRPVINILSDIKVTGNGTESNPYVVN